MKHTIGFPSVFTGRRVRWTFELSLERREIPVSTSARATTPAAQAAEGTEAASMIQPAAAPVASAGDAVQPAPVAARRVPRSRRLALATAAVGILTALVWARYLVSGEEYDPADAFFASEAAATDHELTVERAASAPATSPAPAKPSAPTIAAPAAPVKMAPAAPVVHPIAARQTVVKTASPVPVRTTKPVEAPTTAAAVAVPAVETREPEKAATTTVDAGPRATTPSAVPMAATAVDEVTLTGCLEIDTDGSSYRLADTEGEGVPKARSWRSGFFKKRATPVDLAGPTDALSLHQRVGQRVAATGVLTSRTLTVSSVRIVSPSCN